MAGHANFPLRINPAVSFCTTHFLHSRFQYGRQPVTARRARSTTFMGRSELQTYMAMLSGPPPPLPAAGDPTPRLKTSANQSYIFPLKTGPYAFAKANDPDHRYLCANEWVTSCVGLLAGFDLLPIAQLAWADDLYLAWPNIGAGELAAGPLTMSGYDIQLSRNHETLPYQCAALDALVANSDRHEGNVVVVSGRADLGAAVPTAFLIDHDRTCFWLSSSGGMDRLRHLTLDWVDDWVQHATAWLRLDASWREGVTDLSLLHAHVARLKQAIPDTVIDNLIAMLPPAWCPGADRPALFQFLSTRRKHLKEVLDARLGEFPNLARTP
jgi:hypothetical protein